jgi:large subunit ribosomal protein L4
MDLQVINPNGQVAESIAVADAVFARDFNENLVHQVVVAYLAGGRAGTRAHKTRSEVRGGGSKPWRQKGTGRARAGTIRSPLWRSGGVTFAARPQDHGQKVNRKMYRAALRSIFSELLRQERLIVVSELSLTEPRTKQALQLLQDISAGQERVLFLLEEDDNNFALATRNVPQVSLSTVAQLSPSVLVGSDKVVVSKAALARIEEWLA